MAGFHSSKRKSSEKQVTNPLVSLPNIVLTRIDEQPYLPLQRALVSKPRSSKKTSLPNYSPKADVKNQTSNQTVIRPRGRPRKKFDSPTSQTTKLIKVEYKKINKTVPTKSNTNKSASKLKGLSKQQSNATKSLLKKTMLQKKSRIAISQAKKPKVVKKTITKSPPVKANKHKLPVVKPPPLQTQQYESSEDEFLYDELIDEFEETLAYAKTIALSSMNEKKTITVKPSTGNKPPTIVKGGIVKINKLPSDLKTIVSPGQPLQKNAEIEKPPHKRYKLPDTDSPVPVKKPSPWPVSISKSLKTPTNSSPSKSNETSIITDTTKFGVDTNAKEHVIASSHSGSRVSDEIFIDTELDHQPKKPKIGPKQTAKVTPMSKPIIEDDVMSDEYTEEETLEEYEQDVALLKQKSKQKRSLSKNTIDLKNDLSPVLKNVESQQKRDGTNNDLLKILTDELEGSERPCVVQTNKGKTEDVLVSQTKTDQPSHENFPTKVDDHKKEEPQVRTIYDLINDISLQRPSWNLHIVPETNAFCIAQVTKGRLGLPTLKKCIELDPDEYSAKVYIHQYHIKRFDGVYDSEDAILGLIEEIDSIKA